MKETTSRVSIREELAIRISDLARDLPYLDVFWDEDKPKWSHNEAWLALADECLRQMEWARNEGYDAGYSDGGADDSDETVPPLTLAPTDWKP